MQTEELANRKEAAGVASLQKAEELEAGSTGLGLKIQGNELKSLHE